MVLHQFRLSYTTTLDDEPVRVTRTIRYAGIGTTRVERPPWYDEAIANTTGADSPPLP